MTGSRHGPGSNLRVPTPRARIRALGGCVLLAVALGLCFFARPSVEPGHFSWLSNFARQLVHGVMVVGGSGKDDDYPEDLHDLVRHGIMSEATFRFITTIKLDGGRADAHGLYCQGLGVNSPPESVVLASPF